MGKYEKKKKSALRIVLLGVLLICILAAFVLFGLPQLRDRLNGESEPVETAGNEQNLEQNDAQDAEQTEQIEQTDASTDVILFPIVLEEGKLEIDSLFQFSGVNPDSGNQSGDNIAAILVKNTSDTYLESAVITLTIPDGTQLNFKVTDLPEGRSAMAFSLENAAVDFVEHCTNISCDAVFNAEASLQTASVSVSVSAMSVTLTNNTEEDLSNLVIYCRSPFGDDYFGGLAYQYSVNSIPAKGSTTIDAVDCILGVAEVVRIEIDNEE